MGCNVIVYQLPILIYNSIVITHKGQELVLVEIYFDKEALANFAKILRTQMEVGLQCSVKEWMRQEAMWYKLCYMEDLRQQ